MKNERETLFRKNELSIPTIGNPRKAALLVGLIAGEQIGFYADSLTTGIEPEALSDLLASQSKNGSVDVKAAFNFLKEEGERAAFDIIAPIYLSESDEEKREEKIKEQFWGVERFVQYNRNLNNFLAYAQNKYQLLIKPEDLLRGILAWDLGNMVALTRIAYDCLLINEEMAWSYIEFAGKECRRKFISWREVGMSYLLGQVINTAYKKDFDTAIKHYLRAINKPESPWNSEEF